MFYFLKPQQSSEKKFVGNSSEIQPEFYSVADALQYIYLCPWKSTFLHLGKEVVIETQP